MQPSYVAAPLPARPRAAPLLLGDALKRPGARRTLAVFGLLGALVGAALVGYPVLTDVYSHFHQGQLAEDYASPDSTSAYAAGQVATGDGLTRMRIPRLGVDVLVVEGTTQAALRAGAGHYRTTPFPGQVGNVGIAGHRTTFGKPLARLDELGPGDDVELATPLGTYLYRALPAFAGHGNPYAVDPSDVHVLDGEGGRRLLTLTTCHPKGSAAQRLVLRLELVSRAGPARAPAAGRTSTGAPDRAPAPPGLAGS